MRLSLLIGLLLTLAACQQQDEVVLGESVNPSPIVATVNGIPIHESDIDIELTLLPDEMSQIGRAHV